MENNPKAKLEQIDDESIRSAFSNVFDSSISTASTSISALSSEYKHLDELNKLMILKVKDIHQQILQEGNAWFDKRTDLLDSLEPFFTEIESMRNDSAALLKMMKKIDEYTKTLEKRAKELY